MDDPRNPSFGSLVGSLLFLTGIFFLNFLSRVILSPLMPAVQEDLKVGHGDAGSFFLLISLGYCVMLVASGFISSHLNHRRTIIFSSLFLGGALLVVGFSHRLWEIRFGLLLVGMAAGLYLPSAIATITDLVSSRDWGKAIAIHELAPNLGFVVAPFLAEVFLKWGAWQGVFIFLGIAVFLVGFLFICFSKGGQTTSQAPNLHIFRNIFKGPSFWIMVLFFALGVGAQFGVYAMLPLFLVSERGMDGNQANFILGISRLIALGMTLISGWITDHFGAKQTLKGVFLSTGVATLMLALLPGRGIFLAVIVQAMLSTCFFTPGFAALSQVTSPRVKHVAISLALPVASFLGAGALPAGFGLAGELGSFTIGFALLGGMLFGSALLVQFLEFRE